MIKAIFFDLDGTLLPMDEGKFTEGYFDLISEYMKDKGYIKEELIKTIWSGTKGMYINDGSKINEERFWDVFVGIYGEEKLKDKKYFDQFYVDKFPLTKKYCGKNKYAKEIIDYCKENFQYVVLSTNPIFPAVATKTRMSYIGLCEEDFDFVTYYENFNYCKPNPQYFLELLKKFNLKPEEVILFGNNTLEDGECALACGIKCVLVDGNIIYSPKSTHSFEIIKSNEVIDYLKKLII